MLTPDTIDNNNWEKTGTYNIGLAYTVANV